MPFCSVQLSSIYWLLCTSHRCHSPQLAKTAFIVIFKYLVYFPSNHLVGLTKIKIFLLIPCRGEILRIPRRISPLSLFRAFQQVFSADPSHLCKKSESKQNISKYFHWPFTLLENISAINMLIGLL